MNVYIDDSPSSYRDAFILFCESNNLKYELKSKLLSLTDCQEDSILLLYPRHYKDSLPLSIEKIFYWEDQGHKVFPSHKMIRDFDDKVKQSIRLSTLSIPTPLFIYRESFQEAAAACKSVQLPVVFKLKKGAGSSNVRLIKSKIRLMYYLMRSFTIGFASVSYFRIGYDLISKALIKFQISPLLRGLKYLMYSPIDLFLNASNRERGYLYLQEFVPNQEGDIRVLVAFDRFVVLERANRHNDFRASGSGLFRFPTKVDNLLLNNAQEIANKLGTRWVALDFLVDQGSYKLIEYSYGCSLNTYIGKGFFSLDGVFHDANKFNPLEYYLSRTYL